MKKSDITIKNNNGNYHELQSGREGKRKQRDTLIETQTER